MSEKITPRSQDYSAWYIDIVREAKLADYSPVKGCMVIRPRGYALWEEMQKVLDTMFKETGHQNAYFPMLIPESFLKKEAEHVEGFSPELAVVTHAGGEELEEPLVLRPTSETIIWSMFKKWIHSHRDLPIKINQWANVIRWEKRTRLFLRTTEFLWQEGHTAHETAEEAEEETLQMLEVYRRFAEDYLAIPVFTGVKTESEKFAGAVKTYCIEAMMQDKKALQAGTSHNLGQNFGKAFEVKYQTRDGSLADVWASSWGVSTRLMGALIMTHSDDKGLVIPPRLAPIQVVCIPIFNKKNKDIILPHAQDLFSRLKKASFKTDIDLDDQNSTGWRLSEWELLGVPIRLEVGPKDMENFQVTLARRDTGEKEAVKLDNLEERVASLLEEIQKNMYERALSFREANTYMNIDSYKDLTSLYDGGEGGFILGNWCGCPSCEEKVKNDLKVTIRCIPLDQINKKLEDNEKCLICGKQAKVKVLLAKSY